MSYAGILFKGTIATDTRFKAAVGGAALAAHVDVCKGSGPVPVQGRDERPWKNAGVWIEDASARSGCRDPVRRDLAWYATHPPLGTPLSPTAVRGRSHD